MNYIDIEATRILSWMYKNQYVKMSLLIILAIYFAISPKLPDVVSIVYNNIIFKLLIVLFIIFLSIHDKQLGIMITAVYLLTIYNLHNIKNYSKDNKKE